MEAYLMTPKEKLTQLLEGIDFDDPTKFTDQQVAILELALESEIVHLCANSPRARVPSSPLHEQTRCGSKDGANGDASHDNDVDNQRGFHNSVLIGMLGENLLRLKDGLFGLCEDCEEPIGKGRLIARLLAVLKCTECQTRDERNRDRGLGRHTQVK
jgi:DnaK suppressor protein